MDIDLNSALTVIGSAFSGSLVGIGAIIKQARNNVAFDQRLKVIEDERKDIHEIKEKVTEIQIYNAKYFTILESNQETLKALNGSLVRIHNRIDKLNSSGE